MSFLEYVVLLQKRWRIWLSAILIGLLAALALSVVSEKQYTAVSTSFVTVADEDAAGSGEIFQGSQFAVQRMASYVALSSSPFVLEPVIEELNLGVSPRGLRQMVDVSSPAGTVMLDVSVQHSDPARAADIANEMSRQLGILIEELETPRGLAASSVKVTMTMPAVAPVEPSSPRIVLNLLLGLAGGAAVGLVLALLRHHHDRRVKSVGDIEELTGTVPLGSTLVPRAGSDRLVALDYRSVEAERYRTIKTALKLADPDRELRHFVVSSPTGDGADVAANLAVSWALTGASVCLVDARLRRPAASVVFDVDSTVGLSDVLVGDVELDTVLTEREDWSVTVLPAGYLPLDPVELLGSEAMARVIDELRSRFDIVIYDSGPLLEVSDAVVLARGLDGLVLVVRAGKVTSDELEACLGIVRQNRLRLLGTVWSGVRRRRRAARRSRPVDGELRRAAQPDPRDVELSPTT
ncbi:polysaccharide biosynthesis tyrosine autokinase [Georgenia subflava]|nr:polysaccharide biosynthesis tyrosine autokinase [Georgenia subflava]